MDNYFFAAIRANKLHGPQTLRIRCETNVFSLYRGAAELDMEIVDDAWTMNGLAFGGVVSPTTDLRGGATPNDPGNSALTGCGTRQVPESFMFSFFLATVVVLAWSCSRAK